MLPYPKWRRRICIQVNWVSKHSTSRKKNVRSSIEYTCSPMPIITLKTQKRGNLCLNGKNKFSFLNFLGSWKTYPPRPEGLSAFAMFASPSPTASAELNSDFPIASNPYFAMSLYLKITMVVPRKPQCSPRDGLEERLQERVYQMLLKMKLSM